MKLAVLSVLLILINSTAWCAESASQTGRFFFSGDGFIHMVAEKGSASYSGRYRLSDGQYDESAYRSLCRVFEAPYDAQHSGLSLRLIEFVDYLQDRLSSGAVITITSGYRSPVYNTYLQNKGALAAKASLHQYGMAADFKMEGIAPKRIWELVRSSGFGGAGYYHGETVHVDVGPARFWDEKSSGVGNGKSDDNKLIGLVTDFDFYHPGDKILIRFIRMTAFPIGVNPQFALLTHPLPNSESQAISFNPSGAPPAVDSCAKFENIAQMSVIQWSLPQVLFSGRYTIRADFCDNPWEEMPSGISSAPFEVVQR